MNLENKKQLAILSIAAGLGIATVFLAQHIIKESINQQTKILYDGFKAENDKTVGMIQQQVAQELGNLKAQQQQLAVRQDQLGKQIASASFGSGQPQQLVAKPETASPFSYQMPSGKRAVTINIDSLSAVGGLITPGDFIDIIAQLSVPLGAGGGLPEEVTSIIFQNLEVLAVGANFNPSADVQVYSSQQMARSLYVTLAVDPEEAGLLLFAQTKGRMQLTLRPPKDRETKTVEVASWQALADFVYDRQGTELLLPRQKAAIETVEEDDKQTEIKPKIQIFKNSKEY